MNKIKAGFAIVAVLIIWYVGAATPEPKPIESEPVEKPYKSGRTPITYTSEQTQPHIIKTEFNERFLQTLNIGSMGKPSEVNADGYIYALDQSGELHLSQKVDGLENLYGVYINVKEVRQDTVFAALVFYEAAIKAYNPYADPNAVFRMLGLDANLVEDLPNPKSANINGITYSKKMIGKSLSLGISS